MTSLFHRMEGPLWQSDQGSGTESQSSKSESRGFLGGSGGAVKDILRDKGREILSIGQGETVNNAVETLNAHKIGAVVVVDDGGKLVGIFSERDVVIGVGNEGTAFFERTVKDVMTRNPVTCNPEMRVNEVMHKMTVGRFRHMPVIKDGDLCGMISIGDVVRKRLQELEYEKKQLMDYMAG